MSQQSLFHLALRYAGLASKPALIWVLVYFGFASTAAAVGSLILVATLIGMAMGNEAHLPYYAAQFSDRRDSSFRLFALLRSYIRALTTHIVLIALPLALLCIVLFPTVDPVMVVGLAIAERVSDEVLRYRLYRKEWTRWSLLLLLKNVLPALAALVAIWSGTGNASWAYAIMGAIFAAILLVSDGPAVRLALRLAIAGLAEAAYCRSYITIYARQLFIRQIAAILSMNVIFLDRYVGMVNWDSADLAYILLVGQIVNGVFFILEAKHLSEHRANFVNRDIQLAEFWQWRSYATLLTACIVFSGFIIVVGTMSGLIITVDTMIYTACIFVVASYALYYTSIPMNDYLYYRGRAVPLAIGHVALYGIYAGLVTGVAWLQQPVYAIMLLSGLLVVRLVVLILMRRHFDASAQ